MSSWRRWALTAFFPLVAMVGLLVWHFPALTAHNQATGQVSTADEKLLEELLRDHLFDPKGAQRVEVVVPWKMWGQVTEAKKAGWLVKDKHGERVFFTDGDSVPVPPESKRTKIDFVARCQKIYAEKIRSADYFEFDQLPEELGERSNLVIAAWLHRLGAKELAAKIMGRLGREEELGRLRRQLALSAYRGVLEAFRARRDEEVLVRSERLLRLYREEAKEYGMPRIVSEVKRRKSRLHRGSPNQLPRDFVRWDRKKQVAFLIDSLESVDAPPHSWAHPELSEDFRVVALLELGDLAVPALLDTLEKDDRLTRATYEPFAQRWPEPLVLTVRETAWFAVRSIVRVSQFDPRGSDTYCNGSDEDAKALVPLLRAYWKEFCALPFEERMMRVLKEPGWNHRALVEAAQNLSDPEGRWHSLAHAPKAPKPAILKFKNPTAAEAILSAMDRDLAQTEDRWRDEVADSYLFPLIAIGDKRILPELTRRAQASREVEMRRRWALACFHLGNAEPLRKFADDFRMGNIQVRNSDELTGIVSYLDSVPLPEADAALHALADPKHPAYGDAAKMVLDGHGWFLGHPFCLASLRKALDDRSLTGRKVRLSKQYLQWEGDGILVRDVPTLLKDKQNHKQLVQERVCDKAADILTSHVPGLPEFYPLLNDADDRIVVIKNLLDRYQGKFRRLTRPESDRLFPHEALPEGVLPGNPGFAPVVRPLTRPATAADVKAGKAVFHLDGKSKLADMKLPALGLLKTAAKAEKALWCLIVQGEATLDGNILFGVIERHAMRAVPAGELARIISLPAPEE